MTTIGYILELIICSGIFLVVYRWLLAKKVSYGMCRAFILTSMLLAVVIPAMNVPVLMLERPFLSFIKKVPKKQPIGIISLAATQIIFAVTE